MSEIPPACSKVQLHLHSWSILKYRFGLPECNPNSLIQPFAHKSQKETSWDLRLFHCTWTIQHNGTFDALEILLTTWDGQKKNWKVRKEDKRYTTGTNLNWLARFLNHQQDSQCFKKETHPPTSCSTGWKSLEKMTRKADNIDGCQGWDHWDYNELSCSDLN